MPDHFHLIFRLGDTWSLQKFVKLFCQFTSKQMNSLVGRNGRYWTHGYYQHRVRDEQDLRNQVGYVLRNPVAAGFVGEERDWPYVWRMGGEKRGVGLGE